MASQSDPISIEKIRTLAGVIGAMMNAAATTVRAEVDLRQKVLLRVALPERPGGDGAADVEEPDHRERHRAERRGAW